MSAEKDHFLKKRIFEEIPGVISEGISEKSPGWIRQGILNKNLGRILREISVAIAEWTPEKNIELLTEGNSWISFSENHEIHTVIIAVMTGWII